MSREKEFVKNSAILSIGTILPKLTSIITLPIVTEKLSNAEYGTFDLITILVALFLPVATLQMQAAGFRYLVGVRGDKEEQTSIISNITFFTVPICVAALVVLYFFMNSISPMTRMLILSYFLVDTLLLTGRQIARGLAMNSVYSISALLNSILEMVLTAVLLLKFNMELDGVLIALLFSQSTSLIYLLLKTRMIQYMKFKAFSFKQIKSLISYSWPMVPNCMSMWVMRVSDRFVISFSYLGTAGNGLYAVANKIPQLLQIAQSTFAMAWQENASLSVEDEDSGEYYGKMFTNVFNILVGMMGLLIAFTPIIFIILIRGDYGESYNHMPILYIGVLFSAVSSYIGGVYVAHMKSKAIGITTMIAALMNFLINIIFVHFIGIYAASISTAVSYLWLAFFRMRDIQKIQKIKFEYKKILVLTGILIIMSAACFVRIIYIDIVNMVFSVAMAVYLNKNLIMPSIRKIKSKFKGKSK